LAIILSTLLCHFLYGILEHWPDWASVHCYLELAMQLVDADEFYLADPLFVFASEAVSAGELYSLANQVSPLWITVSE